MTKLFRSTTLVGIKFARNAQARALVATIHF